jgi:predicted permease
MQTLWQDLRFGARMLLKNPGLSIIALMTLMLGVGANTAIFSVVNGVLLKPLPYPDADRLVVLREASAARPEMPVSYPDLLDWRARQDVFEEVAASMVVGGVLTGAGEPERVFGRRVSENFFAALGVRPRPGRAFTAAEDRPGGERVTVISHGLWQRRYGGDPRLLGQKIEYNGERFTVVGVTPAGFDFYGRDNANNDFFLPLGQLADQDYMQKRDSHPGITAVARMKPGVSLGQARAAMAAVAADLAREHPATNAGVGIALAPLIEDYVGDARPALGALTAAAALVLLIACANVANLLLARAAGRRREIALRLALGATRFRLARQLLTESLLLALGGGLLGLLLAVWGVELLTRLGPEALPRLEGVTVDARVLGFTALVTLLTGVVFGLAPALRSTKAGLNEALKEGARGSQAQGSGLRGALVAAEVALSLMLLVGAGLLLRSLHRLTRVDPGFDPRGVLTLRVRLPDARYRELSQITGFLERLLPRVASLPGVEGACLTTAVPLGRSDENTLLIEGQPPPEGPPAALTQWVSADYHRTFAVALLQGRYLTPHDRADAAPVVLVDEELARRHFPGHPIGAVVGRRLRLDGEGEPWREIVGVVRRVNHSGLDQRPRPQIYGPYEQMNRRWLAEVGRAMDVAVKTSGEPQALVGAIRREVQALDRELPLSHVRTMEEALSRSLAPRRFSLMLLAAFASVALLLSAVGVYGVVSYAAAERTREIGIRKALGAHDGDIVSLVIGQGMRPALGGVAAGLLAAAALTRLLSSLLFGVSAHDPLTLAVVAALLAGVSLAACWIPARRATKVDPTVALRYE